MREGLAGLLPAGAVCPGCGAGGARAREYGGGPGACRPGQGQDDAAARSRPVEVPGHRCGCGVTWVAPELDSDLADALVAAFLGLRP